MTPATKHLSTLGITNISELGEAVAEILDKTYRGLRHLEDSHLKEARWDNEDVVTVRVTVGKSLGLSTVDDNVLTMLVLLAHDHCVRLAIIPRNHTCIHLKFSKRFRYGRLFEVCPTIEDHIEAIRGAL